MSKRQIIEKKKVLNITLLPLQNMDFNVLFKIEAAIISTEY